MESGYVVLNGERMSVGDYSVNVCAVLNRSKELRSGRQQGNKWAYDKENIIGVCATRHETNITISRDVDDESIDKSEKEIARARKHVSSLLDRAGLIIH